MGNIHLSHIMGQSNSKEHIGSRQLRTQPHWQSLVSSSRTSTCSYDSWDSYPALISSQANAELRPKQAMTVVSRLSRVLEYIRKKISRKGSPISEDTERKISDTFEDDEGNAELCRPVKSLNELVSCTKFSREELQQMYRGFKNDHPSGVVNKETFKQIYAALFPKGDCNLYAKIIFNTFDTNHDGKVTFEDFVVGLSDSIHGTMDEKLKVMFRIYDLGNDRVLTREKLCDVLKAFYRMTMPELIEDSKTSDGTKIMDEHIDALFQCLDRNGNGVVTEEIFIDACLNDKDLMDSLTIVNQFDNLQGNLDATSEMELSSISSPGSSLTRPDSASFELSPTLLCRNLNGNSRIPNTDEARPRSALRTGDFELLEIRQRRARCSTK